MFCAVKRKLKRTCVIFQISSEGAEDPEKSRLKSQNEKLKDNIDSLHVELEEIHRVLESKEQRLGNMPRFKLLFILYFFDKPHTKKCAYVFSYGFGDKNKHLPRMLVLET